MKFQIEYTDLDKTVTIYEIECKAPDWGLIKWLAQRPTPSKTETKTEADLVRIYEENETILKTCFNGWRIVTNGKTAKQLNADYNKLPPRVIVVLIGEILRQSAGAVDARVRSEKN